MFNLRYEYQGFVPSINICKYYTSICVVKNILLTKVVFDIKKYKKKINGINRPYIKPDRM